MKLPDKVKGVEHVTYGHTMTMELDEFEERETGIEYQNPKADAIPFEKIQAKLRYNQPFEGPKKRGRKCR